jgi:hypothetical protein
MFANDGVIDMQKAQFLYFHILTTVISYNLPSAIKGEK